MKKTVTQKGKLKGQETFALCGYYGNLVHLLHGYVNEIGKEVKRMNSVILVGRLSRDPETRYTQSQMAITKFNVAADRPKSKNENSNQPTADYIDCVAFGKTAEVIERFFTKGKQIVVQGRIQNNNYTNKDGVKMYTYQVIADRIEEECTV